MTSRHVSFPAERRDSSRVSRDDLDFNSNLVDEHNTHLLTDKPVDKFSPTSNSVPRIFSTQLWHSRRLHRKRTHAQSVARSSSSRPRHFLDNLIILSYVLLALFVAAILVTFTLFPSYTTLPPHYKDIVQSVARSTAPGSGNLAQQKVFLAASLYDPGGELTSGAWADNVLQLIHLLGPDNVYLSIYENDSGPEARRALDILRHRVSCDHTLIYEDHLGVDEMPHIKLPNGTEEVTRIAYLAEVRNKALEPLDTTETTFDKVLYLNDIFFNPIDALQLLFSTNHGDYRAACAVDFIMPFKFYDTYATRDLGGNSMGLPFFPWFAYGGDSRSHQDVVAGKDAVRVRSCWGGLIAFNAAFFQPRPQHEIPETAAELSPMNITAPYRFRAETEIYWEASECCLIHADIQSPDSEHTGIYMNPFVRVAYDPKTLSWLWFTRRFESLYTPIHFLLDYVVGLPQAGARQDERAWEQVEETVWVADEKSPDGGAWEVQTRLANHAGYCGKRSLAIMKNTFDREVGTKNFEVLPVPEGF